MALNVGLEHQWQAERLSYFEAVPDGVELGCVVVMHGGGPGDNKGRNVSLAQDLVGYGYRVLGLDFTGSGESSGEWSDLTLNRRRDQAASLIQARVPESSSLVLIGFSMSGQTAADLVEVFGERVSHLAVCAPGVYPHDLRDTPFGDGSFTSRAFTEPDRWPTSRALNVFATFPGRTLLVLPEHDETIPPGMATLIARNLQANPRSDTLTIPGAGHLLDQWFEQHQHDRTALIEALTAG